jgi:hypothetical protein
VSKSEIDQIFGAIADVLKAQKAVPEAQPVLAQVA